MRRWGVFAPLLLLAACATGANREGATLDQFERALAAQDSATAALTQWCAARGIADPPKIVAVPIVGARQAEAPDLRARLEVGADGPVGYRHVALRCGDATLSDAHNWYVPGRLTPEMNATLNTTHEPFGRVVAPLGFVRERIEARRGRAPSCPEGTILSHRALLRLPDGRPISMVVECYSAANVAEGK